MVKIKVCGVTSLADAEEAVRLGADLIGFNFYRLSPRYVEPQRVRSIIQGLPEHVQTVGLFVNEERERVRELSQQLSLRILQFHGDESDEFLDGWSEKVIKVVRMRGPSFRREIEKNLEKADWVMVDAFTQGYGGGGKSFPWEWLRNVPRDRLFLAGGLDPDNVVEAVRAVRPYAVDVASGVEQTPGIKDWKKLREFIAHVKNA